MEGLVSLFSGAWGFLGEREMVVGEKLPMGVWEKAGGAWVEHGDGGWRAAAEGDGGDGSATATA